MDIFTPMTFEKTEEQDSAKQQANASVVASQNAENLEEAVGSPSAASLEKQPGKWWWCFKKSQITAGSDQGTKDLGAAENPPAGNQDRQAGKWWECFKKSLITRVGTNQVRGPSGAPVAQIYARYTAEDGQDVVVYYPAPHSCVLCTIGHKLKAWDIAKTKAQDFSCSCFRKQPSNASSDVGFQGTKDLGEAAENPPTGNQDRQAAKWWRCFKKNRIIPVGTDQAAGRNGQSAAQIYARHMAVDGQEEVIYHPAPHKCVLCTIRRKMMAWQSSKGLVRQ